MCEEVCLGVYERGYVFVSVCVILGAFLHVSVHNLKKIKHSDLLNLAETIFAVIFTEVAAIYTPFPGISNHPDSFQ